MEKFGAFCEKLKKRQLGNKPYTHSLTTNSPLMDCLSQVDCCAYKMLYVKLQGEFTTIFIGVKVCR